MSQLTFSNLSSNSIYDLESNPLDETLVTYKSIPKRKTSDPTILCFELPIFDVVFKLVDEVSISLLVHWIIEQSKKANLDSSFRINGKSISKKVLKDPEVLKDFLEKEVKSDDENA